MTTQFNLSEAARDILQASVTSKQKSQDKPEKLSADVAYGTKDVGCIGHSPDELESPIPDYTKGVPSAKAPGATPPVGSEPMKKLAHQPGESDGRSDLNAVKQDQETSYDDVRDRKKGKLAPQMMKANPGASTKELDEEVEKVKVPVGSRPKGSGWVLHRSGQQHNEPHDTFKRKTKKVLAPSFNKESVELGEEFDISEDIDALLEGENLSEEFREKATTIFEAAVNARVDVITEQLQAQLQEELEVAIEEVKEELSNKVDSYLDYVVEEWMKENEIAIERGLKSEIVEDFIQGLKDLFVEHYIDIPTEQVNVVEELTLKVEELEESLNTQISKGIELKQELNEQLKKEAIYIACEGLSKTQVEKMKALAEGVEFTSDLEFQSKLETLKESYFKSDVKVADTFALDDEVQLLDEEKSITKSSDPLVDQYVKTISKTLIK